MPTDSRRYIRDPKLRRMAAIAHHLDARMSSYSSGAGGLALVESTPPFQSQSPSGRVWLDTGVSPDVVRVFDGVTTGLYQPGGIAPVVPGHTGLSLTTSGILISDTWAGVTGDWAGHVPDHAAPSFTGYADGVDGSTKLTGANGISQNGVTTGRLNPGSGATFRFGITGYIRGISATSFMILTSVLFVPAGTDPTQGFGFVVGYASDTTLVGVLIDQANGGGQTVDGLQWSASTTSSTLFSTASTMAAGNRYRIIYNGTNLSVYQNGVQITSVAAALAGTGFGTISHTQFSDPPLYGQVVICSDVNVNLQGLRPGWGARIFDAGGVQVAQAAAGAGGTVALALSGASDTELGVGGFTGHMQLFTDNTYTTPITGGRYPAVGNAVIFPGDLYQWNF